MLLNSARKLLLSLSLALPLAGCEAFGSKPTPLPATTELIDKMPRVQNSGLSPCWQQEQIAAQNSYLASVKEKREVVYSAPCKASAKVASVTKAQP